MSDEFDDALRTAFRRIEADSPGLPDDKLERLAVERVKRDFPDLWHDRLFRLQVVSGGVEVFGKRIDDALAGRKSTGLGGEA